MPARRLTYILDGHNVLYTMRQAILEQLKEHLRAGKEAQLVVVTRDIKLARRARKRGARVLEPGEFFEAWNLGA